MSDLFTKVEEAKNYINSVKNIKPEIAIILGTGLGGVGHEIKNKTVISYKNIPHFPLSTVESHDGELILGKIGNKNVVAMQGRLHIYEGYSAVEVSFPVRVMKALGAKHLIISNACGGMNPQFKTGDVMVITDHINLMGHNPLIGSNDSRLGPRFPDMSEPYDKKLIELADTIAREEKIKIQHGVYVGVTGPCLETKAEYRFLRLIGADVVGMSTVPEVIVGVHCGFKILGLSIVTDQCFPDCLKPADITEIIKIANEAEPKLTKVVVKVIEKL
ncbi:MAG: purine-nucleoside phosphorylase [bacterium]|nr:purine-nucleoside phosphorylase [bacterium]